MHPKDMAISNENVASERFSEYVEELRKFSDTFGVAYGKPENLASFLKAFRTSDGFAADFGSMIRSVVFREHFKVSDSELLTLVALAWGGEPADEPPSEIDPLIDQVKVVLKEVMTRGAVGLPPPLTASAEDEPSEELASEELPNLDNTIQELEKASPDIEMYRQLLKMQERSGRAPKPEQPQPEFVETEDPDATPIRPKHHSKGIEVLATSLAGLVVALLFSVAELPTYRAHVTVYLPAGTSAGTATSDDAPLKLDQLTNVVVARMLAEPYSGPILRQDVLSRARRDLHLGDSDPIPYANLVAETAGNIKTRQLSLRNLHEITCESWSAQFATAFCTAMVEALQEQIAAESSLPPASSVDAAVQVYPHWYLQGLLGLTVGCLAGLWMVSGRPKSAPAASDSPATPD